MRPSRALRLLRGGVAATIATFVALLSHVAGGGAMPAWLGVVAPWLLSLAVCTVLAGRALSLVRLTIAVAISQFLFHALFVLGAVGTSAGSVMVGQGTHVHGALPAMTAEAMPAMIHADPTMWQWHAFAALTTIAALHRGERAVVRLLALTREIAEWAHRSLVRAIPLPAAPSDRVAIVAAGAPSRLVDRVVVVPVGLRGPPSPFAL